MFPLAQIARQQKKLVIPIFVRPSFERHEVDKRHYDHAVTRDRAVRLGRNPPDRDSERPRIRGTRSTAAADRVGADEPPDRARPAWPDLRACGICRRSIRPTSRCCLPDTAVCESASPRSILQTAASRAMNRWSRRRAAAVTIRTTRFTSPPGTSLICIQGDWSNLVDAKIKGRLAAAMGADARSPYSPLYARAVGMPRPWGVTALFAEYTGTHQPLEVDWSLERGVRTRPTLTASRREPIAAEEARSRRCGIVRAGSPTHRARGATDRLEQKSSSRGARWRSPRSGSLRLPSTVPIPQRLRWRSTAPHQTSPSTATS